VGERRPHTALFLLAGAAIIGVGLFLALDRGGDAAAEKPAIKGTPAPRTTPEELARAKAILVAREAASEELRPGRSPPPEILAGRSAVEARARRFLAAFFRYEVGELTPEVVRALRASSTPEFAMELLRSPPRPVGGSVPPRARAGALDVVFLEDGVRAQVNGAAYRGTRSEPISLLFERRGAAWLASGLGP
jgi:hypothetical protein